MFTKTGHSQVRLLDRSVPFMVEIIVIKESVTQPLKGFHKSSSKALGPDELHLRVLKELATELDPVIAHLFQQSITRGKLLKTQSLANINFVHSLKSACIYLTVSSTCIP